MPPEDRAKALGWISAATNAGVMIGGAVGSLTTRQRAPESRPVTAVEPAPETGRVAP